MTVVDFVGSCTLLRPSGVVIPGWSDDDEEAGCVQSVVRWSWPRPGRVTRHWGPGGSRWDAWDCFWLLVQSDENFVSSHFQLNVIYCLWQRFPSVLWHCWSGDRKGIQPVGSWVLVCWWWHFDWSFARLISPLATSIILRSNKIQNGDILVQANPGPPGKWLLKWRVRERERVLMTCRLAFV